MKSLHRIVLSLGLTCLMVASTFAGEFNPVLDIKDTAPKWAKLPATDGKHYAFEDFKDKDILVVVFTCNSCPMPWITKNVLLRFPKSMQVQK